MYTISLWPNYSTIYYFRTSQRDIFIESLFLSHSSLSSGWIFVKYLVLSNSTSLGCQYETKRVACEESSDATALSNNIFAANCGCLKHPCDWRFDWVFCQWRPNQRSPNSSKKYAIEACGRFSAFLFECLCLTQKRHWGERHWYRLWFLKSLCRPPSHIDTGYANCKFHSS